MYRAADGTMMFLKTKLFQFCRTCTGDGSIVGAERQFSRVCFAERFVCLGVGRRYRQAEGCSNQSIQTTLHCLKRRRIGGARIDDAVSRRRAAALVARRNATVCRGELRRVCRVAQRCGVVGVGVDDAAESRRVSVGRQHVWRVDRERRLALRALVVLVREALVVLDFLQQIDCDRRLLGATACRRPCGCRHRAAC